MEEILPVELWETILDLVSATQVGRLSCVSRSFRFSIWNMYRNMYLQSLGPVHSKSASTDATMASQQLGYSSAIFRILNAANASNLRSLELSHDFMLTSETAGLVFSRLASCTSLTHLDLGPNCTNELDQCHPIVDILKTLPSLRSVAISPTRFGWEAFAQLTSLNSLTIQHIRDTLPTGATHLTRLTVDSFPSILVGSTANFLATCKNLQVLELRALHAEVAESRIEPILKATPNLRIFKISFCAICTDEMLRLLAQYSKNLEQLYMRSSRAQSAITDLGFQRFCSYAESSFSNLTRLELISCSLLTEASIVRLRFFEHLAALDLSGWNLSPKIINELVEPSSNLSTSLTSLTIRRPLGLRYDEISTILSHLTQLNHLNISPAECLTILPTRLEGLRNLFSNVRIQT